MPTSNKARLYLNLAIVSMVALFAAISFFTALFSKDSTRAKRAEAWFNILLSFMLGQATRFL